VGYRRLEVDGGIVEYVVDGPEDARDLLLFHMGTPCAAVPVAPLVAAAARRGLRTAIYSRGGYGASSRRRGRRVVDEVAISAALVDHLGFDRFVTAGYSGGGPVALACAALLPDRVHACLVIGSLAPWAEVGDAFRDWVADPDDWARLARGNEAVLVPEFEVVVPTFSRLTVPRLLKRYGATAADRAALADPKGVGVWLGPSMRRAVSRGFWGWLDDNVAEARDWGCRMSDIRVPVVVRHGELDKLVDVRHGRWLVQAIPSAGGVFLEEAGHIASLMPWQDLVDDLLAVATT
jgi:pimeloyl-ACP methyl ester carboxylesterase